MRNLLSNKKGQVQTLAPAILGLVFAAIVLVFGLIMSQELRDTQAGKVASATQVNESFTFSGTGITSEISASANCGYTGWNASAVMNGTALNAGANGTLVEGTDYTINVNGSMSNLTTTGVATTRTTYTYNTGGEACEGANATVVGLGTFADFWEIIVLAIIITIVIGLLLVVFGGRARR